MTSGAFATASDVVRAGLQALQERDTGVERWLREDVVRTYERWKADPGGGISSEDMADRMRKRHETRLKGSA